MDIGEFTAITKIIRTREPITTAVMLVLFDGHSELEASEVTEVVPQTIKKTVARFNYVDAEIRRAYTVGQKLFTAR